MPKKSILAWYFAASDLKLRHGDGRKIEVGVTHKRSGEIALCESGLHASKRLIDALQYAPGPIVCRVRLSGKIVEGDDKLVASERTYLSVFDATRVLHEFACDEAERALKWANVTDERCWNAIKVKRLWLGGKASGADLDAARVAARAAAWAVSSAAAWAVSRVAASAVSSDAASAVSSAAAWAVASDVAWAVARDAAWAVSRDAQNKRITAAIRKAMKEGDRA